MKPTPREFAAAHALTHALLEFLCATDERRAAEQRPVARPAPPPVAPVPATPARKPDEPESLLLTSRQAAAMLSISERTLWKLRAPRGPIPAVLLGTAVRFSMADLRKAIDGLRVRRKDSPHEDRDVER